MTRINANGEGEALIDASKVRISGDTTVNDIMGIFDRNVQIRVPLGVNGGVTANSLTLRLGGDQATISAAKLNKAIVEASVSGNTLTLTSLDGTKTNFSKAVDHFNVGAGGGNVYVTAWPQNQRKNVPVFIGGSRSITTNGDYTYRVYAENDSGDPMDTGSSISVNVAVESSDPHPNHRTFYYQGYEFKQGEFIHKWTSTTSGSGRPGPGGSGNAQVFYW